MKQFCKREISEFLKQSNYIEGEYSDIAFLDALMAWDYLIKQDELNKDNILETHRILMERLNPRIAGKFRTVNVRVGNRICPSWTSIRNLMNGWKETAQKEPETENEIKLQHIWFEKIHPFEDGNGRIGRIILNWQRVRAGLPILIIKESERYKYYKWFEN